MHRKKTRRWHKLLSVSGIIVAVFGMFYVPAANAQLGGPAPDGLYGPTFSKDDNQIWYLDLPNNAVGFENTDLYVTGTATGCKIDSIPNMVVSALVSGCEVAVTATIGSTSKPSRLHIKTASPAQASTTQVPKQW